MYQDPNSVDNADKSRLGQAHRWYFLLLKDAVTIDLTTALEREASAVRWVPFAEAVECTDELKKHVYQELETYFLETIWRDT